MKIFIFLLLQSLIVNARYRNDINTNVIAHGELSYLIAKIQGNINKMSFIILLPLTYSSISYFYTENVKHQSYKYWKPEKGIASRTFPSTHFSQVG